MKLMFVTERLTILHLAELLKGLSLEHEITILTFDKEDRWIFGKDTRLFKHVEYIPFRKKNFLLKTIRSLLTLTPVVVETYRSDLVRKKVEEICKKEAFDLIVLTEMPMGQYFDVDVPYPVIFYPADALSRQKMYNYKNQSGIIKRLLFYTDYALTLKYEKHILNKFDISIFLSKEDVDYVHRVHKIDTTKLKVTSHAVDTEYFICRKGDSNKEIYLAFLGFMKDYKNEHAILWFHDKVWDRLKAAVPDLKLYIIGDSPSERVKALSSEDIIVTGFVEDFRPFIWESTIVISPLHIGAGIKNRVLQAMAMGKPVIATSISMDGIHAENGKDYLLANEPDEFLENILSLLNDRERRESIGLNARSFIERNHTIEAIASRFIMIAMEAVCRNRPHKKEFSSENVVRECQ